MLVWLPHKSWNDFDFGIGTPCFLLVTNNAVPTRVHLGGLAVSFCIPQRSFALLSYVNFSSRLHVVCIACITSPVLFPIHTLHSIVLHKVL
jgi:hypothetical protein